MKWEDIGYLKASKHRLLIFKELSKHEQTPKELQNNLDLHFSQISLSLKELLERDLVQCLNDESRKGKIYSLSKKGKELEKSIDKMGY